MSKTYLNPHSLFPSQQYGFSQVVASAGRTTVYVSGQVGWNAKQQMVDPADLGAQTRQALENLEIAAQAAGGTRTDIVSLRLYIVADHIHNARPVREAQLLPARRAADQHPDRGSRPCPPGFSDRNRSRCGSGIMKPLE